MKNRSVSGRFWSVVYPIFLYMALQIAAMMFGSLFAFVRITKEAAAAGGPMDFMENMNKVSVWLLSHQLEMTVAAAVISLPILAFLYLRDFRLRRKDGYAGHEKTAPALFALMVPLGLAACILGNNLITFSGLIAQDEAFEQVSEALYRGNLAVEFIGIGIIVPIVEELVFRGLVYRRFRDFVRPLIAGGASAFAFAIFHGNLVQGVYAFFLGALMCYVYEKYQSLLAPVLIHMSANLLSVFVSESDALAPFFTDGTAGFWAATAVSAVVIVLLVTLVDKIVQARPLPAAEPAPAEMPYDVSAASGAQTSQNVQSAQDVQSPQDAQLPQNEQSPQDGSFPEGPQPPQQL